METKKLNPVYGTCCGCGYTDEDETPCTGRKDGIHCVHWWEGPEEEWLTHDKKGE